MEAESEKALLMHAVHHVVMGHLSHPRFAHPAHPEAMQLAMEISANEFVPYAIPHNNERAPEWKQFEEIGLRSRQSTMQRYELLAKAKREGHAIDFEPTCDPAPGCGGGLADLEQDQSALDHAREIVLDAIGAVEIPPHGKAGEIAGKTAGNALTYLNETTRAPEVSLDWRAVLARFASRVRTPVHTYARPSRRFPKRIGEVPGRSYAPQKGIRPRIACAIDTSASLERGELEEIALHLREVAAFADVTIIECDARIQRIRSFDGALKSVRGRGGTDLRPPFERSIVERFAPDGVVYFTDGLGPTPQNPPNVPVLWVLTKPTSFRCAWGERVTIR